MRIAIVGPGAMGTLFAAFLKRAHQDVFLIDKDSQRAERISKGKVKVKGSGFDFEVKIEATAKPQTAIPIDLVIIFVKSYDTKSALKKAKVLIGKNTNVLTLQNGIGNTQTLSRFINQNKIITGVTSHGATLLKTAHIRYAGRGKTFIGRVDGKITEDLRQIQRVFNEAKIETEISKDINSLIWNKLIVNVGINALTAITRLKNGELLNYQGTRDIMSGAVKEAIQVAKAVDVRLSYKDSINKVEAVCRATKDNISSMLQDVLRGKKTEIDFINGAIVKLGKKYKIPTTVNEFLTKLVKVIESSFNLQVGGL